MPIEGEQTMPVCGSCGKSVSSSDITCPHCGVLLAAYASPAGSTEFSTDIAPTAPPATEIPAVDLTIPPPSETPVVTNPEEVAEEAISTAPRPLFDTNLTVEAIAKAAEGDHEEDLVTIKEQDIQTKTVAFDVPAYAKPPANAAPVPIVEDVDPAIPVITTAPSEQPEPAAKPAQKANPEPESSGESWLYDQPVAEPKPKPQRREKAKSTQPKAKRESGQTEDYIRRLHAETGYDASEAVLSQSVPGTEKRPSPAQRGRRGHSASGQRSARQASASANSIRMGCLGFYGVVVAILWISTLVTMFTGHLNWYLLFFTVAMTWTGRQVIRIVDRISQQ